MNNVMLLHGDCLALLPTLADASVDAIITDPPYSSGGMFRGDRTLATSTKYVGSDTQITRPEFAGDNRDQRAYGYWCGLWLSECLRIAKPGAICALFTDWRQLPTTTDALQAGGWVWRGIAVWDKTEAARPQKGAYRNQCEYIVWGTSGPLLEAEYAPCLPGVFRYVVRQADKHHITGKPTHLMESLLQIVPPSATVLDPFMGSGTTGVAAVQTGRGFIGMEKDPAYYAIAEQRIRQAKRPAFTVAPSLPLTQSLLLQEVAS